MWKFEQLTSDDAGCAKCGTYVRFLKMWTMMVQVLFQYKGVRKVRLGQNHWTYDEEEEWEPSWGATDAEHWDESMYSRVFLQPQSAQLWELWNR